MKSPSMTHYDDYLKTIKLHLLRHAFSTRTASASPDSSDDEASVTKDHPTSPTTKWQTVADIPHLELMRRSLNIKPPTTTENSKNIQAPVLELK